MEWVARALRQGEPRIAKHKRCPWTPVTRGEGVPSRGAMLISDEGVRDSVALFESNDDPSTRPGRSSSDLTSMTEKGQLSYLANRKKGSAMASGLLREPVLPAAVARRRRGGKKSRMRQCESARGGDSGRAIPVRRVSYKQYWLLFYFPEPSLSYCVV